MAVWTATHAGWLSKGPFCGIPLCVAQGNQSMRNSSIKEAHYKLGQNFPLKFCGFFSLRSFQHGLSESRIKKRVTVFVFSRNWSRGQESWLGRGQRISQHTCTCCTVMLHASCAAAEVAFECTARIGNVVSLRLWTSKIFSSCALQTFLLPLTHHLAKVPPSAVLSFSRPSPSPSLFALVDRSAQIAWTARETERLTRMFGFCAEHRQGSSPSVLSRGVLQQSGILVVWSHFRPSNVVLKSIDSTAHTVREIDCCAAALAACMWCKFDSSSLASWAREGTHGNHKMAICRAAASQSFRSTVREGRRKLVFVRWRRLPWAHPGVPAGAPWIRNL